MTKVRKEFSRFYFDASRGEEPSQAKPNTTEVDAEFENYCPFCKEEDILVLVIGATSINDCASVYDFDDSYAITICKSV